MFHRVMSSKEAVSKNILSRILLENSGTSPFLYRTVLTLNCIDALSFEINANVFKGLITSVEGVHSSKVFRLAFSTQTLTEVGQILDGEVS